MMLIISRRGKSTGGVESSAMLDGVCPLCLSRASSWLHAENQPLRCLMECDGQRLVRCMHTMENCSQVELHSWVHRSWRSWLSWDDTNPEGVETKWKKSKYLWGSIGNPTCFPKKINRVWCMIEWIRDLLPQHTAVWRFKVSNLRAKLMFCFFLQLWQLMQNHPMIGICAEPKQSV